MSLIVGGEKSDNLQISRAPEYKPRPLADFVWIEPVEPTADLMAGSGIIMPMVDARRKREQLNEAEDQSKQALRNKMTHAKVLAVGSEVTRVKVGDTCRFIGVPTECIVNMDGRGRFVNCIPQTNIYMVLDPQTEPAPATVLS